MLKFHVHRGRARLIGRLFVAGAAAVIMSAASPGEARAQGFVSPFLGFNFGGDAGCPSVTDCEDKRRNWGVAAGSLGPVLGLELEFGYADDFFGDTPGYASSVVTLMGNFLLAPKFGPVRPYGLVGAGLIKSNVDFTTSSLLSTSNNDFGWNIGGGLMILFGEHVGVRGDIRYFHAFQDLEILGIPLGDTKLDFGRASAGVVFQF